MLKLADKVVAAQLMFTMLAELSRTTAGYSKVRLTRTAGVLIPEVLVAFRLPYHSWGVAWGSRTAVPVLSTFGAANGPRVMVGWAGRVIGAAVETVPGGV